MNFESLFGKKENKGEIIDKRMISEKFSQKIKELELSLNNESVQLNSLKELIKYKLKPENISSTKRDIFKSILIEEHIKRLNETIMKIEAIKFKLDRIAINTKEELNFINNNFNSLLKILKKKLKKKSLLKNMKLKLKKK